MQAAAVPSTLLCHAAVYTRRQGPASQTGISVCLHALDIQVCKLCFTFSLVKQQTLTSAHHCSTLLQIKNHGTVLKPEQQQW